MMPASAASVAPRREVSSQGCTTIVVAAGTDLARAIRRSYLTAGRMGHRAKRSNGADAARFNWHGLFSTQGPLPGCLPPMPRPVAACGETASPPRPSAASDCSVQLEQPIDPGEARLAFGVDIATRAQDTLEQVECPPPPFAIVRQHRRELPRVRHPGRSAACRIVRAPRL